MDAISIIFKYCNKNCRISDTLSCLWTLVKSPNKIENFREFWGQEITQKQPKMSFHRYMNVHLKIKNSRTTDSILLKPVHYVYHFNPFQILKTEGANQRTGTPQNHQKMPGVSQIGTLIWFKKGLENAIRLRILGLCVQK